MGYDARYYFPKETTRDIDVSFVGISSAHRYGILEAVAEAAEHHGWRIVIGGPWYNEKPLLSSWKYRRKHPALAPCLVNRVMDSAEVAALYRRSKICLNINTEVHRSISPRTIEILATRSFQLMNDGQEPHGVIDLAHDLAVFRDIPDLLTKIAWYLHHDAEREAIAAHGDQSVNGRCSMEAMCSILLERMEASKG